MHVTLRQSEFSDFEALRDAVQDAPAEIVQLERGRMSGTLIHQTVGSVGISSGEFSRSLRGRGVLSGYRWTFCYFTQPGLIQHFETTPGDLFLLAPGHEHYASYRGGGSGYTAIFVEPGELFGFIDSQAGARDALAWRQSASLLAGARTADAAAEFSSLLVAVRTTALPDGTVDFYKRRILFHITAPVLSRASRYRGPHHLASAVALVRNADDFISHAGPRPVHTSELCEALAVSDRTLHRAFSAVHNLPPMTYLRRKRFGAMHSALLAASGPDVSIGRIAIEQGFAPHEHGRVSAAYRKMFGELPRETLRRALR